MSIRPLVAAALSAAALSACATAPYGPAAPAGAPGAFSERDFVWSQASGQGSIEGRVVYTQNGRTFQCVGSAGLTPDTPYTRARFRILYGSTDRAALPAAVVRARGAGEVGADYHTYVRSTACREGRFTFTGLPDGGWFLIVPVTAGEAPMVLMRHVETRGGRVVNVAL